MIGVVMVGGATAGTASRAGKGAGGVTGESPEPSLLSLFSENKGTMSCLAASVVSLSGKLVVMTGAGVVVVVVVVVVVFP